MTGTSLGDPIETGAIARVGGNQEVRLNSVLCLVSNNNSTYSSSALLKYVIIIPGASEFDQECTRSFRSRRGSRLSCLRSLSTRCRLLPSSIALCLSQSENARRHQLRHHWCRWNSREKTDGELVRFHWHKHGDSIGKRREKAQTDVEWSTRSHSHIRP